MTSQAGSLFPEASQDGINVLEGLVDLSSFFRSWKSTCGLLMITALLMKELMDQYTRESSGFIQMKTCSIDTRNHFRIKKLSLMFMFHKRTL